MSDEEKNNKKGERPKSLNNVDASEAGKKGAVKLQAVKAAKALNNSDSPWTLTQEIFQEIQAAYLVANPDSKPHTTKMVEDLKNEIERRYTEDEETKKTLLDSIPSITSVRSWLKREGWEEAVWQKVRGDQLFSPEKRARVIESLRQRAENKSDQAAKLWLTMSGDYSEKMEVNDNTVDTYREINKILHNKNQDE